MNLMSYIRVLCTVHKKLVEISFSLQSSEPIENEESRVLAFILMEVLNYIHPDVQEANFSVHEHVKTHKIAS